MYIDEVMTHFEEKYPGAIYCWDVVNEAVADNAGEFADDDVRHVRQVRGGKTNLFYDYIGSDYVELAFRYAYESRANYRRQTVRQTLNCSTMITTRLQPTAQIREMPLFNW